MGNHIKVITVKLNRVLHLFHKLKGLITEQFLLTVYCALFHRYLKYGNTAMGAPATDSKIRLSE